MPKLPNADPKDMHWYRWVQATLQGHDSTIGSLRNQTAASTTQRNAISNAVANSNQSQQSQGTTLPQVPVGPPQQPTIPLASTDHGTVTIRWDGLVMTGGAMGPPKPGFNHVNVQRATQGSTYTQVGTNMGIAGTLVDSDVVVGQVYTYRLVTTDNLGEISTPSDTVSITVKGVDLGGLDADVTDLLNNLQYSAVTGGLIYYGPNPPSDPSFHASTALWFDESGDTGAIAKRWDATTNNWVAVPFGVGAFGPGSITASAIVAGAIDTDKLRANAITADKIGAGQVTALKLAANSITANAIAAHAIEADKIAAGAVDANALSLKAALPTGTQINRVPKILSDAAYWADVISGNIDLNPAMDSLLPNQNVSATSGGVIFNPSLTDNAYLTVTATLPVPDSHAIHVKWAPDTSNAVAYLQTFTSGGTPNNTKALTNNAIISLASTSASYCVYLVAPAGTSATTISSVQVFEVIGGAVGSQQAAQLSPSGLRLYNDAGQLSVDLSTSTTNFFSILSDDEAVATVDENGDATFSSVQVNTDYFFNDDALVGDYNNWSRSDGTLTGPLLERLPRGIAYQSNWTSMEGYVVNTQFQRIASGSFSLDPGREYQILTDLGGLQTTNNSGVNAYIELQLSTTHLQTVTDGVIFARAVVYDGNTGYWAIPPIVLRADAGLSLDPTKNQIPSDIDIYWQINTNLSVVPTGPFTLHQYAGASGLSVIDIGPAFVALAGTDHTTSGATSTGAAGSGGSGSSTNQTKTTTWTASWSASWNQSGSNKVTGTGTYTDGQRLYQGYGASNMGAKFGFPSSVQSTLTGKTITKVEVFLQNRWTWANSGGTATLAAHSSTSAGSTFGSTLSGSFTEKFTRGQGRWFTVSNSAVPFSSWKSGAAQGLALVVQGGDTNYSYYDGVGKSSPPKLRITYS